MVSYQFDGLSASCHPVRYNQNLIVRRSFVGISRMVGWALLAITFIMTEICAYGVLFIGIADVVIFRWRRIFIFMSVICWFVMSDGLGTSRHSVYYNENLYRGGVSGFKILALWLLLWYLLYRFNCDSFYFYQIGGVSSSRHPLSL